MGQFRKPLSGVTRTKDSTDKFYRGEAYKIYGKLLRGYQLYHESSMSRVHAIDSAIKYCSAYSGLADAAEALRYQMITVSSQVVAKKGYTATKTFNSTKQKTGFKNSRNQALYDYYGKIPIGSISKATDMNKLYFTLDMRPQQDDGVFPRQLGSYSYIAGQGYATVTSDNSKEVIALYKENTYQIGKWCMGYPLLINDYLDNNNDDDEYPGVEETTDGGDDYCSLFGRGLTGDASFNNAAVRLATLIKNKKTMSELPSYTVNGESNANKICLPLKPSNAIIQFSGGNSTLEGISEADVRKFLIREGFPTIQAGSTVYDSSKITLAQLKNSALGLPQAIKTQVLDRKNSNGRWTHLSHLSSNVNDTIDAYMNIEVTKDGEDVTPSIIQANISRLRDNDDGYYDPVEGFKYFELDYTAANGTKRKHRYYYPARFYKANYDDLPAVVKNRLTAAYGDSSMVGNTGYVYISGNNYTVKSSQATSSYVAVKKKKYMDMLKLYMRTLNFRYKLMFNYFMPELERIYGLLNLAPNGDMNPHTGYGQCFPYIYIWPANASTASAAYTTLPKALQRGFTKGDIFTASNVSNAASVVGGSQPSGSYINLPMSVSTLVTTLPATVTDSENGNSYVKSDHYFSTISHELTHRNHKNDACYR